MVTGISVSALKLEYSARTGRNWENPDGSVSDEYVEWLEHEDRSELTQLKGLLLRARRIAKKWRDSGCAQAQREIDSWLEISWHL
jgi:hypothetical protein